MSNLTEKFKVISEKTYKEQVRHLEEHVVVLVSVELNPVSVGSRNAVTVADPIVWTNFSHR